MPPSRISIAREFAGRYLIDCELGRGASAVVYLATDATDLKARRVAIKVLRDELASGFSAERFLREIRLTAQLNHPNIVPVFDSGEWEGQPYYVLPYMEAGTLRDRLNRDKQLPVDEIVAIGRTIAGALAAAHARNVLHRDVKPENILFSGGEACLADFGIARAIIQSSGEATTSTGVVRGTPAYMSPEQASGDHDYDGRSDIYSLACVLYEALAGVPAFVGASSASVLAQRMVHSPRPVRVYRPSVTPALETVLQKALELAPADRYQSAAEFARALETAAIAIPSATYTHSGLRVGIATITVVAVVLFAARGVERRATRSVDVPIDTTRLAILPFDVPGLTPDSVRPEDLLAEGFRHWRDVRVVESFEVGDAVRRRGVPRSSSDSRALARELGAGRFVRGQITELGAARRVTASLFDVRSDTALHSVGVTIPAESLGSFSLYRLLADSLALRGQTTSALGDSILPAGSLAGTQLMVRAAGALRDWELPRADSLYALALEADPGSPRAALWLAQIREWENLARSTWAALADRAARDSSELGRDERPLAAALAAMGATDYPRACDAYTRITRTNPRQFSGWFGLGQCLHFDNIVVADARSPTGWRFRSSYQRAIDAYVRAFELLPSVYRSYQGRGYWRLRNLLFTTSRNRRVGRLSGGMPQQFSAAPTLAGDTIAFIPVAWAAMAAGRSVGDSAAIAAAIGRTRGLFRQITTGWATAFASSAGAKEGLALSLEMQGDPAAIDSVESVLRLAPDHGTRLRLVASLAWLDLKFGLAGDSLRARDARRLSDSVLAAEPSETPADAGPLSRLAATTGRCTRTTRYSATASALRTEFPLVSARDLADADARSASVMLGCPVPASVQSVDAIAAHLADALPNAAGRAPALSLLLGRIIRHAPTLEPRLGATLAPTDYLIAARLLIARGFADSARARMLALERNRRFPVRGDFTPDAALAEARLWLSLGDTTRAVATLDHSLGESPFWPPMDEAETADNVAIIASALRAAALRADLSRDPALRGRWSVVVRILWSGADPSLRSATVLSSSVR
ncbi:MAG: serine/threonine-protein kinase [Gemmatimonadales bacterium]